MAKAEEKQTPKAAFCRGRRLRRGLGPAWLDTCPKRCFGHVLWVWQPACCGFLLSCDVFCLKGGCSFGSGARCGGRRVYLEGRGQILLLARWSHHRRQADTKGQVSGGSHPCWGDVLGVGSSLIKKTTKRPSWGRRNGAGRAPVGAGGGSVRRAARTQPEAGACLPPAPRKVGALHDFPSGKALLLP